MYIPLTALGTVFENTPVQIEFYRYQSDSNKFLSVNFKLISFAAYNSNFDRRVGFQFFSKL